VAPKLFDSTLDRVLHKAGFYSHAVDRFNVNILYPHRLAESSKSYMQMIGDAYSNERIFARHTAQIDDLIEAAKLVGSRPVFILWPNLSDPINTGWMVAKVKIYLHDLGIPSVDLSNYVLSFDLDRRIVNRLDSHPSADVNYELGLRLARCLPSLDKDSLVNSFQACIDSAS